MLSDTLLYNPFIIQSAFCFESSFPIVFPSNLEQHPFCRGLVAPQISQSVGAHHSADWVRMTSETPRFLFCWEIWIKRHMSQRFSEIQLQRFIENSTTDLYFTYRYSSRISQADLPFISHAASQSSNIFLAAFSTA